MTERQDPFRGLQEPADVPVGDILGLARSRERQRSRGPRKRPRYPSEDQRVRLTLDVDLEPQVAEVLRVIAENGQDKFYGPDPIRLGDLGTAALMIGLLAIVKNTADIEAEWTSSSRGRRSVIVGQDLTQDWHTLVSMPEIGPFLSSEKSASRPPALR